MSVPSANPRRSTVYMNTPGQGGVLETLLRGRAISIDTTSAGVGESGIRVGATSIPTVEYLERSAEMRNPQDVIQEAIDEGRRIKFLAADIETGGVGPYDLPRSIAAQMYELPTDAPGATVTSSLQAIDAQRAMPSMKIDFHMLLPEMQTLTSGQRGTTTSALGLRTAMKESGFNPDRIMDLATPQGRSAAAQSYEALFRQIVDPDTFLIGNNIAGFDIPRLISGAASLSEFTSDSTRAELLELVAEKANSDKVLDVTDIAGRHLFGRLQALQAAGGTVEEIVERSTLDLLSPETLLKAGIEGEGVKPRSIESIVLSTNLLERLAESGPEGRAAIQQLASGNHVADIDQFMSMSILREVFSGNLDLLRPTDRGIIPDSATLGITDIERDALVSNIGSARTAVSRASAVVPTSNIASIEEVSDQVFSFLQSPSSDEMLSGFEGIQSGARVKQLNAAGEAVAYIQYNKNIGQFERINVATGRRTPGLSTDYALQQIREAIQLDENDRIARAAALASGAPAPPQVEPRVLSLGINQSQASQMENTFRYISQVSSIGTSARVAGMQDILSTEAGQDSLIESLSATRRFIGMPHVQEQPSMVSSLLSSTMRGRFDAPAEESIRQVTESLHRGGAGLAMMDPVLRSNFVAISTLTGSTPFEGTSRQGALRIAEAIKRQENPLITPDEMQAYLQSLSPEQINSLNTRALDVVRQTSEMGVSSVKAINETTLFTLRGPNTGTVAKPRLSQAFLQRMQVPVVGSTATESFIGSQFYLETGLSKAHLSIVDEAVEGRNIVNLVMGTGSMNRESARTLSESIANVVTESVSGGTTANQLVEQGIAGSIEEAEYMRNLVLAGDAERVRSKLIDPLTERIMDSGIVIGYQEGEVGRGIKSVLGSFSGTPGNDRVAIQRGLLFETANMSDETIEITAGIDDAVFSHAQHTDASLADAIVRETGRGQLDAQTAVLATAETDSGFRSKLKNTLGRYGTDIGIRGSRHGVGIADRVERVAQATRRAKPFVYKGGLAVAAFSAGYYLAKRNRKENLYDEVMEQQPIEDQSGLIQQANSRMQQNTYISSTRRDPLVTAGVVGNLDRNKIGHTNMGPNKYNNLFGN